MKYIAVKATGDSTKLEVQSTPVPEIASGEVLIRVYAAGINRPDILQRQGIYPAPMGASPILGLEVAGEIVSCATEVTRWHIGDKVCALVNGGGYAQFVAAPAAQCLPIPAGFSFIQAAALPETFFTVWHNIWQRARIKSGETLLIHGGASGIGTTAIQMAKALSIKVIATASTDEKCIACAALGASVINYNTQDFVKEVKRITHGQGVDVILDMVGGANIQRNISAAATDGRIVNIAFLRGSKVEVDFIPLMLKRLTLTGSTLRAQSPNVKAQIAHELEENIWPLLIEQKIVPVIDNVFPFEQVIAAHQRMESNQHIGKIILTLE